MWKVNFELLINRKNEIKYEFINERCIVHLLQRFSTGSTACAVIENDADDARLNLITKKKILFSF